MITKVLAARMSILLILLTPLFIISKTIAAVPTGQLPNNIVPTHYALTLKIDPTQKAFSGTTSILLNVKEITKQFFLNGKAFHIKSVTLKNARNVSFQVMAKKTKIEGILRIIPSKTLYPGTYTITFNYNAPFNGNLEGLYQVKDGNNYYAYTQMEAISARLAFPSFDEPRFKTPYDISLIVPKNLVAIANTPISTTSQLKNNWKKVTFKTTKPLPTYLVAFFVGDFDVVNMPDMPATSLRNHAIPLSGIAAKGKGKELHYALSKTRTIVEALEDYFQIPYPYQKLDVLAVPDFAAGAMENAGAITYREQLLLLDDKSSLGQKRRSISVQAHELSHQWFGDLVTPVWWNDIWLNEAFATWMAATALDRQWPNQQWKRQQVRSSKGAMNSDSIPSARKIRNPIKSNSDIVTAFDGITYQKGSGVLFMIENYMGKENFRHGVQKYLRKYAWKNTTADDFFNTIASVLPTKKARAVVKSFKDFVEQAGVPLLSITQACQQNQTILEIKQHRYTPLGTTFKQNTLWNIPVCMHYEVNGKIQQQCNLLTKAKQKITLHGASCASWVMPNANALGYYRFNFNAKGWKSLIANLAKVNPLEANAVLDSMKASFNSGDLTVQNLIDVIPATVNSNSWEVVTSGMGTLSTLIKYADKQDKAKLRTLAGDLYRATANKIGFVDNTALDKKDPIGTNQLRSRLIAFMAFTAKDQNYRKKLTKMAINYMGYHGDNKYHDKAIIPSLRATAMAVAVQGLGQPFVDALIKKLNVSTNGTLRGRLISALTSTKNPVIGKALINFSLTSKVRVNEKSQLFFALLTKKELDSVMWPWLQQHFKQIVASLPTDYQSSAPYLFINDCSAAKAQRLDQFLKPRLNQLVGADRTFAKAKEYLKQCMAQKSNVKPQIKQLVMKLAQTRN